MNKVISYIYYKLFCSIQITRYTSMTASCILSHCTYLFLSTSQILTWCFNNQRFPDHHPYFTKLFVTSGIPVIPAKVIEIIPCKYHSWTIIIPPGFAIVTSAVNWRWKIIITILCGKFHIVMVKKSVIWKPSSNNISLHTEFDYGVGGQYQ